MNATTNRFLSAIFAAVLVSSILPDLSFGRDRLSYRATEQYRRAAKEIQKRSAVPRNSRPALRVRMNNTVYKYESTPHMDGDKVSSPEIIFHKDRVSGRIIQGHAWDY